MDTIIVEKKKYEQFDFGRLMFYTFLPAVLILLSYMFMLQFREYIAPFTSFMIIIFVVLIPVELGIILLHSYQEGKKLNLSSALQRHQKKSIKRMILPALLLAVVAALVFGIVSPLESAITGKYLFGWFPEYAKLADYLNHYQEFSRESLYATLVCYAIGNGILGPIVEELYFRGFLLSRMEKYGKLAPLFNAILFSLYHLFSPWEIITRIIGCVLYITYGYKKRNVIFGMLVHCIINTASVVMTIHAIL